MRGAADGSSWLVKTLSALSQPRGLSESYPPRCGGWRVRDVCCQSCGVSPFKPEETSILHWLDRTFSHRWLASRPFVLGNFEYVCTYLRGFSPPKSSQSLSTSVAKPTQRRCRRHSAVSACWIQLLADFACLLLQMPRTEPLFRQQSLHKTLHIFDSCNRPRLYSGQKSCKGPAGKPNTVVRCCQQHGHSVTQASPSTRNRMMSLQCGID